MKLSDHVVWVEFLDLDGITRHTLRDLYFYDGSLDELVKSCQDEGWTIVSLEYAQLA